MIYDVIVLGGGIVGASTAYALVRQGLQIALIDQFEPGHTHGSSHGDSRVVRFNYSEAIYTEMALLAYPAWETLAQAAGQPFIQKTGLIEYGPPDCPPIQAVETNLRQYDLAYERMSAAEAQRRFPQFHFNEQSQILFQPDGAVAFATPAVNALWHLTAELGGGTLTGQRIEHIEIQENSVSLSNAGQSWQGRRLVLASGAWTRQLATQLDLDLPITVTQEVLAYFPSSNDQVDHRVGVMPMMIDYFDQAQPFYCLPQVEVPGVKVGWHHSGPVIDADQPQDRPPHLLAGMRGWVGRAFPHLDPEPVHVLDCLYSNTPDFHFILDRHPRYKHVVIGAGFSGHGFKFGPVLGELLAGLVLDQPLPLALDDFNIARFQNPAALNKRIGA